MYIFEVVTFFSCLLVIQSSQLILINKFHDFDEAVFLRMPIITKLFKSDEIMQ